MSRAAVLGRPVSHSLSPVLHRAAYAALGLTDWSYEALDIGADDLPVLLAGLGEEWRGFSVTMPCKQAAVDVADAVEPLPRLLHAANTLVRTDAGWRAENTDVGGLGMALQLAGVEEVGAATVIGAGGTAAATAVALASLGAEHVDVVVRDPSRAVDVTRVLDVLGVPFSVTQLADATLDSPLVVSTVPIAAQPALLHLPWRPRRWPSASRRPAAGSRAGWTCCSGRPPRRSS
jgi:shikimate dehydrogenase